MNSEYTLSEVVEIGRAQDVILGDKPGYLLDDEQRIQPNLCEFDD